MNTVDRPLQIRNAIAPRDILPCNVSNADIKEDNTYIRSGERDENH